MKNGCVALGMFETSGVIYAIDPCYDDPSLGVTVKVSPGQYSAYAELRDKRVARLVITKVGRDVSLWAPAITSEVGVDSGQAGFFDEDAWQNDESVRGLVLEGETIDEAKPWYSYCCDKTLAKMPAGVIPGGVVSSSGWGDGCYMVSYGHEVGDGEVVGLSLDFMNEEGEED